MSQYNDQLSSNIIKKYLNNNLQSNNIFIYDILDSTNIKAKELALKGGKHGTVVLANMQTKGKGQMGKAFFSPQSGIYMSIILKPKSDIQNNLLITVTAAVAVAQAIEELTKIPTKIKWVNDIFIDNKKICGILTEAVTTANNNQIKHIILGIGINFNTKQSDFPYELQNIAGSIFQNSTPTITRNMLISYILNNFLNKYDNMQDATIISEYKKRSIILNKQISITYANKTINATVIDIDENCHLVVKTNDGTITKINSGIVNINYSQIQATPITPNPK